MLDEYANQAITLKVKGTVNGANEATTTTSTIYGRMQYKHKLVRNKEGQEVLSTSQIFTESVVRVDDLITVDAVDYPVIAVDKPVDLDGNVQWYEVFL